MLNNRRGVAVVATVKYYPFPHPGTGLACGWSLSATGNARRFREAPDERADSPPWWLDCLLIFGTVAVVVVLMVVLGIAGGD